jgi:PIN domain nuclease of toxin-antitoxin system
MRFLVDTQILLWMVDEPSLLPKEARFMLEDRSTEITFSLVSIWEVSIKFSLRRPDFRMPPEELLKALRRADCKELEIADRHMIGVSRLPLLHRDPFDRLLVAQAQSEGLTLMTTDKMLSKYGRNVQRFR